MPAKATKASLTWNRRTKLSRKLWLTPNIPMTTGYSGKEAPKTAFPAWVRPVRKRLPGDVQLLVVLKAWLYHWREPHQCSWMPWWNSSTFSRLNFYPFFCTISSIYQKMILELTLKYTENARRPRRNPPISLFHHCAEGYWTSDWSPGIQHLTKKSDCFST